MTLGKIIWFGGFNTQKNKVNDYGFIHPLEDNITQDLYVHRTQIPETIQPLLESPQGSGIYVIFDLDTENTDKLRAINIQLYTQVGIVKNSIIIESDSSIHSNFYYNSDSSIQPGNLVKFAIKSKNESQRYTAFITEVISSNTNDKEIITYCFNSQNYSIFTFCFSKYIYLFNLEQIAAACLNKIEQFPANQQQLLNLLVNDYPQIILNFPVIRKLLSNQLYLSFVDDNSYIFNPIQANTIKQELLVILSTLDESQRQDYWNSSKYLRNQLTYRNYLWDIAPKKFKQQIIKEKYQSFFDLLTKFNNSEFPDFNNTWADWRDLYDLDDNESKLVKNWIGDNAKDHVKSQMISARGAEKLVMKYYQSLGYFVEDISIHQITLESNNWIKGDIRLNQQELLDVKNARYPTNSNTYSEFCVPQFKQNRNEDVKVVSVISPYLILGEIHDKRVRGGQERDKNPQILGSFTATELARLESVFSNSIFKVNMNKQGNQFNYLPPWLFDYDDIFYREQQQIVQELKELPSNLIPDWEDISLFPEQNFISLVIAAKTKIPLSWWENLDHWVRNFINLLFESTEQKITLPYLFLTLLSHFLTMLSVENTNYSPQKYKELLYGKNIFHHALKIYDHLDIISDFCDTLNMLWAYRHKYRLQEFKIFKFNGRGLLQAQRFEAEYPPTTILAYCGGWTIDAKGKCGYTPLIIGQHEICPKCHHLICPKKNCGYCSKNCSVYEQRKKILESKLKEDSNLY